MSDHAGVEENAIEASASHRRPQYIASAWRPIISRPAIDADDQRHDADRRRRSPSEEAEGLLVGHDRERLRRLQRAAAGQHVDDREVAEDPQHHQDAA